MKILKAIAFNDKECDMLIQLISDHQISIQNRVRSQSLTRAQIKDRDDTLKILSQIGEALEYQLEQNAELRKTVGTHVARQE